ncbi:MAG: hypothetical protein ACO23C_04865 [Prochlorococcaceae cyanobacterium]|jgi:hypothetical protein
MKSPKPVKARRVFRRRPPAVRWKQIASGLLLMALGTGLLVGLMQLPERLDTLLLVSTAIANLIGGLGRFLLGLLQLLGVLLLAVVAIGSLVLLVAGLVRLIRGILRQGSGSSPSRKPLRPGR